MIYRERHYNKLLALIDELNITVVKKPEKDALGSGSNCWNPEAQFIYIGTKDTYRWIVGALVHELGHCLLVRAKKTMGRNEYLRSKFQTKLTDTQAKNILKEEKTAWTFGFRFMRKHGIEIDERMYRIKSNTLGSWKRLLVSKQDGK